MPKMNVPATGWAIDQHRPISFVIGLSLCDAHFAECKIGDFLHDGLRGGPSTKDIVRIMARGRCPPDFDRAFLSKCRIDSDEAKVMLSQRG
jgi:hypothetical protein